MKIQSRVVLVFSSLLVACAPCTPRPVRMEFIDRPSSDEIAAGYGARECGYLCNGVQIGHWMDYHVAKGNVLVTGDSWFDDEGRPFGVQTLGERNGIMQFVAGYRDGKASGFQRGIDQSGATTSIAHYRNGVLDGWEYNFANKRMRFYEEGRLIREQAISPELVDLSGSRERRQ